MMLLYSEEGLRQAYLKYKAELKGLFEDRAEIPTIEEFRFTYEDEVVDAFLDSQSDEDDDDDD